MGFRIPSLNDVVRDARNAFKTQMPGSNAQLNPSNVMVSAKVLGGAIWQNLLKIDYVAKQIFVSTADTPYLEKHAEQFGITRLGARKAHGVVELTGVDAGTTFAVGQQLEREDGVTFVVTKEVTALATTQIIALELQALIAGSSSNTMPGELLSFSPPLAGAPATAEVAGGIGGGSEEETDDQLRARVLDYMRLPPHGGARHDYERWIKDALPATTSSWVIPHGAGVGTVLLFVRVDDRAATGAELVQLQDYIDEVSPVTAIVTCMTPVERPVNITIRGLAQNTPTVKSAIELELREVFRTKALMGTVGDPAKFYLAWIYEAISIASGERYHSIVTPPSDLSISFGEVPVLGSISYVD